MIGRYIINVQTKQIITDDNGVAIIQPNNYGLNVLWGVDTPTLKQSGTTGIVSVRNLSSKSDGFAAPLNLGVGSTTLPAFSSVVSGQIGTGVRFVRDSSALTITQCNTASQLKLFLQNVSPIFVHNTGVITPVDADGYIQSSTLNLHLNNTYVNTYTPGMYTSSNNYLAYTASSVSLAPKVYIAVRDAAEGIYDNYTDVYYYLLYPGTGWKTVVVRFNNETKRLESAYSSRVDPKANPLVILKTAKGLTKLHIFVDNDLNPTPVFPDNTTDEKIISQGSWGLSLDAGTDLNIIEAEMIKDDSKGSKPPKPFWKDYQGDWINGTNKSPWFQTDMLV